MTHAPLGRCAKEKTMAKEITIDERGKLRKKAMPSVRGVVKKYDLVTVQGCLNLLREEEIELAEIEQKKVDIEKFEKESKK